MNMPLYWRSSIHHARQPNRLRVIKFWIASPKQVSRTGWIFMNCPSLTQQKISFWSHYEQQIGQPLCHWTYCWFGKWKTEQIFELGDGSIDHASAFPSFNSETWQFYHASAFPSKQVSCTNWKFWIVFVQQHLWQSVSLFLHLQDLTFYMQEQEDTLQDVISC